MIAATCLQDKDAYGNGNYDEIYENYYLMILMMLMVAMMITAMMMMMMMMIMIIMMIMRIAMIAMMVMMIMIVQCSLLYDSQCVTNICIKWKCEEKVLSFCAPDGLKCLFVITIIMIIITTSGQIEWTSDACLLMG